MSTSNLGLRDCILTSAVLSPVEFQNVLSDLSSSCSRLWSIPLLLFQTFEQILVPPLFLLKLCFIFQFFI